MADVVLKKEDVENVAKSLRNNSATIVDDLIALRTAVNTLLADEAGGLWLRQASPVLSATYEEFNKMLTDAIANIPSFAASFENVAKQITDMDDALAKPST
jgi:hypothetical protein